MEFPEIILDEITAQRWEKLFFFEFKNNDPHSSKISGIDLKLEFKKHLRLKCIKLEFKKHLNPKCLKLEFKKIFEPKNV